MRQFLWGFVVIFALLRSGRTQKDPVALAAGTSSEGLYDDSNEPKEVLKTTEGPRVTTTKPNEETDSNKEEVLEKEGVRMPEYEASGEEKATESPTRRSEEGGRQPSEEFPLQRNSSSLTTPSPGKKTNQIGNKNGNVSHRSARLSRPIEAFLQEGQKTSLDGLEGIIRRRSRRAYRRRSYPRPGYSRPYRRYNHYRRPYYYDRG